MSAWLFQDVKRKQKLSDACPWSVGWYDPDGKRKSRSIGSKSLAEKFARKMEGQIAAGVYQGAARKRWADFRKEYETRILPRLSIGTRAVISQALDAFEGAVKPASVKAIRTATIDLFIAERQKSRGRVPGTVKSAPSINKELRHLKAVLRVAHEWGYLAVVPKVRMLKEADKLPRYVTPDDLGKLLDACSATKLPDELPYPAADWWEALLTFAYMTGWRICECLALRRKDLDLEAGHAITRAADNKGKRDEAIPLHPVVIAQVKRLASFEPIVFPWHHGRRELYAEFHRIQKAAGIAEPYGFHDLRRAFATLNAPNMTGDALQKLMRHRSYTTTQRYINLAGQVSAAVPALFVPAAVARLKTAGA